MVYHSLCGSAVIVLEQSAEAFAANNLTGGLADRIIGLDDLVVEPLMFALGMKMGHEVCHRVPEHLLAEEDHPVQTLFLDRPYPAALPIAQMPTKIA